MFKSMTAYSRKSSCADGRQITVEIRSVNNKFLDLGIRLPRTLAALESELRALVTAAGISRGKLDLTVNITRLYGEGDATAAKAPPMLDAAAAEAYIALLRELRDRFELYDDISVMRVAENRDIFTVAGADDEPDIDAEWRYIKPVVEAALEAFRAERIREGENLRRDIAAKLDGMEVLVDRVDALSAENAAAIHERISTRLRALLAETGATPDENRVLTECALLADRLAIDEELVRLRSHLCALREMTESEAPVGRRLDFQLQEVNREVNTICSKCQNADIAAVGVELKNETEKIREQIQNIE